MITYKTHAYTLGFVLDRRSTKNRAGDVGIIHHPQAATNLSAPFARSYVTRRRRGRRRGSLQR